MANFYEHEAEQAAITAQCEAGKCNHDDCRVSRALASGFRRDRLNWLATVPAFHVYEATLVPDVRVVVAEEWLRNQPGFVLLDRKSNMAALGIQTNEGLIMYGGGYPFGVSGCITDTQLRNMLTRAALSLIDNTRSIRGAQKPEDLPVVALGRKSKLYVRREPATVAVGEPVFIEGLQSGAIIVQIERAATSQQIARATVLRHYVSSDAGEAWADGWTFRSTREKAVR